MKKEIRVLVVDDTSLRREVIKAMLQSDEDIKVIGLARDGIEAVEKTKLYSPDVITMDLKMPNMNGFEAIRRIMSKKPTPIIIISATIREQTKFTFKCLGLGALDFVPIIPDTEKMRKEIVAKVKIASRIPVVTHPSRSSGPAQISPKAKKTLRTKLKKGVYEIITIAASTGGPEALRQILMHLPEDFSVPILIVQHISEGFVAGLAEWLQNYSKINIGIAERGMRVSAGNAYFAPDKCHMEITTRGYLKLISDKMGYLDYPSADVTLKSVANLYGSRSIGVILTGMGSDGAEGIGAIKKKGGFTIAQDEKSSVVYGMPKVASERGYINSVTSLEKIPDLLIWMAR